MKLFRIKAGTSGILYRATMCRNKIVSVENPIKYHSKEEHLFERHEMIFDPIAHANGQLEYGSWNSRMAGMGYAGFYGEGLKSKRPYLFCVPYNEVTVI